ncbi:MAG: T9SS type A sorting domain-containing protein [Bacteroidales bacterium]|nr:T9SS type A sorting domain-containing protein [Bacteroidales bacterium]
MEWGNNSNAGLNISGLQKTVTANVDNTNFSDNRSGIYANASANYSYGSVTGTFSSCNILDNDEYGIDLYSNAYASGTYVPTYQSARINFLLKNSVVSGNGSNSIKIKSYGISSSSYSPIVNRYGTVDFNSENCIIYNNAKGIITERVNRSRCTINAKFYNSVIYNNNPVIRMDANKVFIYNTNLWDNGISGNPSGICDSLVIESSDVNSLTGIPNGSNNISEDPMYLSVTSGDFHLNQGSPCIDAGANEFVNFLTDFDGKVRIWNATGKESAIVDVGAFEYGTPCSATEIEKEICSGENYQGFTESGVYQIKYTDISGCDSVIILTLVVHPVPGKPLITQNVDTLISSAVSGNQWYFNNSAITGANKQKYVVDKSGEYYVTVTNESDCISLPSDVKNVICTSAESLDKNELRLYPNPVSETLTIERLPGDKETEIEIYNLHGNLVKRLTVCSATVNIDVMDIESGSYFLILNSDKRYIVKIIKN